MEAVSLLDQTHSLGANLVVRQEPHRYLTLGIGNFQRKVIVGGFDHPAREVRHRKPFDIVRGCRFDSGDFEEVTPELFERLRSLTVVASVASGGGQSTSASWLRIALLPEV